LDALNGLKQRGKGEFVFSKPNGQPYDTMENPFTVLVHQAELTGTGVSLHTLRHTFASRLVEAGVDLRTVQELGGWSDLSMVQRYAHVGPSQKTEAVRLIGETFHNAFHNTVSEPKEINSAKSLATA
jgi:site-specific recombinase XerD